MENSTYKKKKGTKKMNQKSKAINIVLLAVCCLSLLTNISRAVSPQELQKIENAVPASAGAKAKRPRKLLVFNLCNGYKHSSIPYWDKALEIMGRKTGAFTVVISSDMSMFMPENLKDFDAVCLNNSTKLDFEDPNLRKSLMDFIEGGKGIVGIHAATDNFYDWPEAAEMMGGQFSGHPWGSGGTWAVKLDDPNHPLTAAFGGKGFKIKDEIYRTERPLYSRTRQRILLSLDMTDEATRSVKGLKPGDADTGISWVKRYGKGRLFYCSLGHNHHITWDAAVLRHFLDGIQFALGDLWVDTTPSTQKILNELLRKVAVYDYGKSRQPLTKLTNIIRDAHDSPEELKLIEKYLLDVLKSDAPPACKQFICRKLSIIGTEESVPTLAEMLTEPETSDMARYALERIPGLAVDQALRDALDNTSGKVKVGIINSLGQRGDRKAVRQLSKLMTDTDKEIARAALSSLGRIGDRGAAVMLHRARPKVGAELHLPWAHAYLMCADNFLAKGGKRRAIPIYRRMYVADEPLSIRIAALRGIVTVTPERGAKAVLDVLKGDDSEMQAMVIGLLREIPGAEVTKAVTAELPNLSVAGQVQLLSVLADRGDQSALPAVIDATKSPKADVRVAAFSALGILGDASSVDLLAQAAAARTGAEREAARDGLYKLRDPGADEKILAGIPQAESKIKVELIRSIGERNAVTGVGTLLKTAKDAEAAVRAESFKVLRVIAEQKDLPALIKLLIDVESEAERKQAERCVAAVARKIADQSRRTEAILAALPSVKDVRSRCSLLSVLGKIGDDSVLPVLRTALKDDNTQVQDAAVRALADWPGAEPAEILIELARAAPKEIHRVLALRGYIRMAGLVSDRSTAETLNMYRAAMEAAARPEEKKLVLARIPKLRTVEALKFVEPYLEDETIKAEAQVAYMAIAVAIKAEHEEEAEAALDKIRKVGDGGPAVVSPGSEIVLGPAKAILTPPMELMSDKDGVLHIVVPTEGQEPEEPGKGGRAIYGFNTSQKGILHLDFYINCDNITNDSWHIKLDDNPYVNWNDLVTKGWEWKEFAKEYPVEQGKHILIIDQREDGAKMSEIRLTLKE